MMKNNGGVKRLIFFVVISAIIILLSYNELFRTFYQQDEWIAVGYAMENGKELLLKYPLLNILAGTGRILGTSISIFFLTYFPFQIWPFSIFAILFHFINVLLVFFITRKVAKNFFIAVMTGFFFALSSVSDQAVIWAGAVTNVLPSSLLIFLSIFFYLNYVERQEKRWLIMSFSTAIIAYYFRESAIFLLIFLPFLYVLQSKKSFNVKQIIRIFSLHFPLIIFLLSMFIIRLIDLQSRFYSGHFVTNAAFVKEKILFHSLLYPITSLSQMFVHPVQMFSWASLFEKIYYPYMTIMVPSPAVYEFVVADMLSFFFSFLLLFIIFLLYQHRKQYRKTIVFMMSFIFLSFLPYAILDKSNAYLESRYYYTSIMGAGVLFGILGDFLRSYLTKFPDLKKVATVLVFMIALLYFYNQFTWIKKDVQLQVVLGDERKNFLVSVKRLLPRLNEKTILYFTGSQDFYTADNKVPFQLGPGYILMTWYYDTGAIPSSFIREEFLSHLFAQGYKEDKGKGFGYYRDFEKLRQDTEKYHFYPTDIYSFYYVASEKKLINISERIRADLNASRSAEFIR